MRKEYDFSNAMPNPYIKKLRKQVAVKIDAPIVENSNYCVEIKEPQ